MSQIQPNFDFLLIRLWRSSLRQPFSLKPRSSGLTAWSIKIRLFVNDGILAFKFWPYSKSNTLNLVVIFVMIFVVISYMFFIKIIIFCREKHRFSLKSGIFGFQKTSIFLKIGNCKKSVTLAIPEFKRTSVCSSIRAKYESVNRPTIFRGISDRKKMSHSGNARFSKKYF